MRSLLTDPTALFAFMHALTAHATPVASQAFQSARDAVHFCGATLIGSKAHFHFCLYGGLGMARLMEAWHDWRRGANHGAREKGLASLVHWILAVLGL